MRSTHTSRTALWGILLLASIGIAAAGAVSLFNAGMIADATGKAAEVPIAGVVALLAGGVTALVCFIRFATALAQRR
ncbi:hypothetical protein [Microbacterium sp. CH-015]|mgnify:CR=1 FL=1|uniref:hypothetical protein n=1 Tax=Microbacterium sp. CH-015 TaxID=3406734 RepID=UPI003C72B329